MLLLGAMSSQNNLLFAIVGLALAAVIVSGFLAGSSIMGLRFARRVPARIEAETPARIVYSTYNKNRLISAFCATDRRQRQRLDRSHCPDQSRARRHLGKRLRRGGGNGRASLPGKLGTRAGQAHHDVPLRNLKEIDQIRWHRTGLL